MKKLSVWRFERLFDGQTDRPTDRHDLLQMCEDAHKSSRQMSVQHVHRNARTNSRQLSVQHVHRNARTNSRQMSVQHVHRNARTIGKWKEKRSCQDLQEG